MKNVSFILQKKPYRHFGQPNTTPVYAKFTVTERKERTHIVSDTDIHF